MEIEVRRTRPKIITGKSGSKVRLRRICETGSPLLRYGELLL